MERPLTPEELVAARAYHQELQRVEAWMTQAERAWDQAHRTEAHWQQAWVRDYHEEDPIPYNPRDAVHQEIRAHWDEGMEERRDTEVWKHFRAAGVVSDRTIARSFEDQERNPETAYPPHWIAHVAAQEKLEAVQERLGAEPRRVAYEQTRHEVTHWLPDAERRYDEAVRSSGRPAPSGDYRDRAIVSQAVQAGVVSETARGNWLSAQERHQHPQLADLAWMEAQHVTEVYISGVLSLHEQRQAVEQVIYAHQRQQDVQHTPAAPEAAERTRAQPEAARDLTPGAPAWQPERCPALEAQEWTQRWAAQDRGLAR